MWISAERLWYRFLCGYQSIRLRRLDTFRNEKNEFQLVSHFYDIVSFLSMTRRTRPFSEKEECVYRSLVEVILCDISKIFEFETQQKVVYLSFSPSLPNNALLLKKVAIEVKKTLDVDLQWRLNKETNEKYAYVKLYD